MSQIYKFAVPKEFLLECHADFGESHDSTSFKEVFDILPAVSGISRDARRNVEERLLYPYIMNYAIEGELPEAVAGEISRTYESSDMSLSTQGDRNVVAAQYIFRNYCLKRQA